MGDMWDRLAEKLRQARTTQKDVAVSLGWSPNRISRWKRGEVEITLPDLARVAAELRTTVGYLVDGYEPDPGERTASPEEVAVLRIVQQIGGADEAIRRLVSPPATFNPPKPPQGRPSRPVRGKPRKGRKASS